MEIIKTRSPYIVSINETNQTDAKIELRIWKPTGTKPTDATYILTKSIPSTTKRELTFNISPFIKDVIENKIESQIEAEVTEYNYVNVELKTFYSTNGVDFTLIDTIDIIGMNGYNDYFGGANQSVPSIVFPYFLTDSNLIYYDWENVEQYYVQVFVPDNEFEITYYNENNEFEYGGTIQNGIFNIPFNTFSQKFKNENIITITSTGFPIYSIELKVKTICEPVFTPSICSFVNKNGGIEQLTFFKVRVDTTEISAEKYNMMPSSWDYDVTTGIYKRYNFNGKDSFKLNTGFVPESFGERIKELLLSENVWVDGMPVVVKTQSLEKKTQIRNKNISYDIEFEYAFDTINSVI